MARKGGKRGGSSAARSAAAKKGWETRRRGGAKAKPAATKRTAASKAKPTAKRGGMPKTTSARGRALTNQRRAADLVRASRGGKGPSAKAVRSVLTAQRARAFYAATGGGKKRSAVKAKSAAKIGKSIRAESRAKATAARAKVAGRVKATLRPNKPNVSMAAMQRRSAKVSDAAILERRQRADTWRDEMAFRSGQYPKSPQKRADYAARSTQAEMNRRQNALVTAQRARDFYAAATFSASNFSLRQRFSTAAPLRNRPLPALTSYFSAWRGYSYKPSKAKKRN